ncbi:MAG TPA: metallophosphoesterase, partial [Terriglobia bacterium]|nr:metallophosphoesterase [Terriglobia bacterium]
EWTREALTPAHAAFLRQLPSGPLTLPGFEIVHGSVQDEDKYVMDAAEAVPALRSQQVQLVFFGHTHYQGGFGLDKAGKLYHWSVGSNKEGCVLRAELESGTRYLLNPGSVGQPRDGNWRAGFAIFDETERRVDFYRTEYDLAKTQEKMSQAGLPEPLIRRLKEGR